MSWRQRQALRRWQLRRARELRGPRRGMGSIPRPIIYGALAVAVGAVVLALIPKRPVVYHGRGV